MPKVLAKLLAVPSGSNREHRVLADEMIDVARQRPVAAADDHHRRLGDRGDHRLVHLLGLRDRMASISSTPAASSLAARLVERLRPAAAHRVDDQDRLAGEGRRSCRPLGTASQLASQSPNRLSERMSNAVLPRLAHAPRPLRAVDPRHARRAPPPPQRPDLAVVHLRRQGCGGADRDPARRVALDRSTGSPPRPAKPATSASRASPCSPTRPPSCAATTRREALNPDNLMCRAIARDQGRGARHRRADRRRARPLHRARPRRAGRRRAAA